MEILQIHSRVEGTGSNLKLSGFTSFVDNLNYLLTPHTCSCILGIIWETSVLILGYLGFENNPKLGNAFTNNGITIMINLSARQKSILQYIVQFLGEKKYPPTIREIGEEVGISSTSVVNYNLTKLENEALISRERDVSRGLSINWDRLMKLGIVNELSITLPAGVQSEAEKQKAARNVGDELFRVPLLGQIAAGEPIQVEAIDPAYAEEFVELTQGILSAPESLFALRVKGDSMIDASVLDGDIVIIRHQETAEDGDMIAAWIDGDEETTLKYLYREGKNVRLQPANPNPIYQPIIRPASKVRINGKVVSVIRVLNN